MRKTYLLLAVLTALLLIVSFSLMSFASDDYESITVSGTAIGFTSSKITTSNYNVRKAYCTLETANIRYRTDGTNPTGAEGHLMEVSGKITFDGRDEIINFSAISTTAINGTLKCTYWK